MQALIWDGEQLSFEQACPEPPVYARHALVRVHLAGICSTDLEILRG